MPRDWRLYAQDILDYLILAQEAISVYDNFEAYLADEKASSQSKDVSKYWVKRQNIFLMT